MKFRANVESLTVLVADDRYCRFINGLYETDDTEEIKALQRAKGVQQIESKSEPSQNKLKTEIAANEKKKTQPKKRSPRVSKPGKSVKSGKSRKSGKRKKK